MTRASRLEALSLCLLCTRRRHTARGIQSSETGDTTRPRQLWFSPRFTDKHAQGDAWTCIPAAGPSHGCQMRGGGWAKSPPARTSEGHRHGHDGRRHSGRTPGTAAALAALRIACQPSAAVGGCWYLTLQPRGLAQQAGLAFWAQSWRSCPRALSSHPQTLSFRPYRPLQEPPHEQKHLFAPSGPLRGALMRTFPSHSRATPSSVPAHTGFSPEGTCLLCPQSRPLPLRAWHRSRQGWPPRPPG